MRCDALSGAFAPDRKDGGAILSYEAALQWLRFLPAAPTWLYLISENISILYNKKEWL